MKLSSVTLGDYELYTIEHGRFKLDGGAMFGVVPKNLWSRKIPADENNCIGMAMKSLLISSRKSGRVYITDLGVGHKFDKKMSEIYGIDFKKGDLKKSLNYHGFKKSDITDIIFTHLHFDHCGEISSFDRSGNAKLNFPDANIWVTKRQWETANNPNAREKASFFRENLEPISSSHNLNLIDDEYEYEPGLTNLIVNGHTLGQQLPVIKASGKTVVFAADLLPTFAHVPLPWVMGYDMYPATTLEEKQRILTQAAEEGWYFYLQHDADNELITIKKDGNKFSVDQTLDLSALSDSNQ